MKNYFFKDEIFYNNNEEYRRVYQECLTRIDRIFSNGFTLVTMVTVIWSFALSAFVNLLTADSWKEMTLNNPGFVTLLGFIHLILFALPSFIIMPFSAKYEDNFRGIISTSCYIRAFYEMPSFIARKENKGGRNPIYAWESIHCDAKLKRTRFAAIEYSLLAFISLVLSVIITVYYSVILFRSYYPSFIIYISLSVIILLLVCVVLFFIFKNTSTQKNIKNYYKVYLKIYTDRALSFGLVNENDKNQYLNYIDSFVKEDEKISNMIRGKISIDENKTDYTTTEDSEIPRENTFAPPEKDSESKAIIR